MMAKALDELVTRLEHCREQGRCAKAVLDVVATRDLSVPIDHETCGELRALAQVFSCEPAELASAILRAACIDLQEHLDDDLDKLAAAAEQLVNDPCVGIASEEL
ncbi:hypothetical protein [Pseudogulbenkiania ferrooxidans]|uniref:Uncharacterized protein n=2 Tax=Pseudogulbenkiania TaxID=568394 RepID=B9Z676_9NEIS|nr:hypothetical protein [Pseudogulbenkiania ferrooxidans]EEG07720.1 conserved hypothetical protein [Pseudogulbenkiania ferrooxidans 2002]